jgi:hypothetical protein
MKPGRLPGAEKRKSDMRRTSKGALTVVGLVVAALAVPTVSVFALPPTGDDGGGGGPIERPTTTRPTTTTTSDSSPRQLESLSVTTDSVVATATIRYTGDPSTATVQWGDGTSSTRCPAGEPGPVHSGCFAKPWTAGDPPGTIVLQHVYAAPANGAGFTVAVTAQLAGESTTVAVGVTPRYRVTQGTVSFSPLNHCDSIAEANTEWHISRGVTDRGPGAPDFHQEWDFDRTTLGGLSEPVVQLPEFLALPGSAFSLELTATDFPRVVYFTVEIDPVFDQFISPITVDLNPLLGSRSFSQAVVETSPLPFTTACRVAYEGQIDVALLAPVLSGGPVLGQ